MAGLSAPPRDAAEARGRCAALVRAGDELASRPIAEILRVLGSVARRWRDPAEPARREAERALADRHRVPIAAVARVLDAAFEAWTSDALAARLAGELGDFRALDGFVEVGGGVRRAFGPRLAAVIASRGVPTTPVADLVDLLCVKAPAWVKPAAGADDLAARFARTVREEDAGLGAAIEVGGWTRGSDAGAAVLAEADVVVATGGPDALAAVARSVGSGSRIVAHGPRLSAAIITREALARERDACVRALADDVAFAGQVGCLSPVVAWVEADGDRFAAGDGEDLARAVQRACEERWPAIARASEGSEEQAAWAEWRARCTVLSAAAGAGGLVGDSDRGWSVAWRADPAAPDPPPAPRILVLSALAAAEDAAPLCASARGRIASVGIAGSAARRRSLAEPLARAGVERIVALGRMQRPPAGWRRDGRASLADLVRWIDREE